MAENSYPLLEDFFTPERLQHYRKLSVSALIRDLTLPRLRQSLADLFSETSREAGSAAEAERWG